MNILNEYGWNSFHELYFLEHGDGKLCARVISIKGFKYEVMTSNKELETELSGRLLFAASSDELPKVGDWVLCLDYGEVGYIIEVFPRMNELARKNPGTKIERQILATNIDAALIVQSLDQNFNLMRLERYLVQLAGCGIKALVVLNKADLVSEIALYESEVKKIGREVEVVVCSTVTGIGLDHLSAMLEPQKTYVMIGSSGVGKSSLVNHLMGNESQKIGVTSYSNQKGKHTTTSRELFRLVNGSLMIDTPGMREFGVTGGDDQSGTSVFPMIDKFAESCRFADCKHINETGCAVLSAVQDGSLDHQLYESYVKLLKEQRRFEITAEEKKRSGKMWGKITKEAKNHRKKYKF
ncbi:MAG: ribosome small subunit-dependent GTPase A [Chryseolinea sp.]